MSDLFKTMVAKLGPRERVVFAYACARRVGPIYRAVIGEGDSAEEALERLRLWIGGLDDAADGARELVTRLTEDLDPEADDEARRAGVQAAVSIASALETLYLDSVKGAEAAARFAVDAMRLALDEDRASEEVAFQKETRAKIQEPGTDVDLSFMDRLPQPVWLAAVSPAGPLAEDRPGNNAS